MNRASAPQLLALAEAVDQLCVDTGLDLWVQPPYLHQGSLCAALWDGPGPGDRVVLHVGVTPAGTAVSGPDVVAVHSDLIGLVLTEEPAAS